MHARPGCATRGKDPETAGACLIDGVGLDVMHGHFDLLTLTDAGLHCPAGDFYVDPWQPVNRAIITHAHADHARPGAQHYLTAKPGRIVLQHRLGPDAVIDSVVYRQP